jgi:hypothetical protein
MKVNLVIKNGNSIWFDIHEDTITSVPCASNPSEIYEYLGIDKVYPWPMTSWDKCKEIVGGGIEIPGNHFKLEYLCKDSEKGEDGCTVYLKERCRSCRCKKDAGFIVTHSKNTWR